MAVKLRFFSEADLRILEEALTRVKTQQRNTSGRPKTEVDSSMDRGVFVAKTPAGGISAEAKGVAGSAECFIYHLIGNAIESVSSLFKLVYNIHSVDMPGNAWIIVVKDNRGSWLAVSTLVQDTGETGTGTGVGSTDSDEKVKVSSNDTTAAYLDTKIVAGPGVRLVVLNDGANESLRIDLAGTGTGTEVDDDERVKVSSNDSTASYLLNKLVAGSNITLTEQNDGGNETLRISWQNPDTGTGTITDGDPLTVEAVDGSPSYSGVRRLQFDEADDFRITNPSPGIVRIDLLPPGTGTDADDGIIVQAADGSPSYSGVRTIQFDEVDGFVLSNPNIGTVRIDKNVPCGSATFYTYRYRCQAGNLNEYRQLVTLDHGSDKCLRASTGEEEFMRAVACCDPTCADELGTSTGTFGTSTGGLCCDVGPRVCVSLTNISNSAFLNGLDVQLTYDSSVGYWRGWSNKITNCPVTSSRDFYIGFSLDCDSNTGQWYYNWITMYVAQGSGAPALSWIPDPTRPLSTVCTPDFRGEAVEDFGVACLGATRGTVTSMRAVFTEGVCPSDTGTGTGTVVTTTGTGTTSNVDTSCCSGVASVLTVTPTGTTGACSSASFNISWDGVDRWTGTYSGQTITFRCPAGANGPEDFLLSSPGCGFTDILPSANSCSPFSITFAGPLMTCCAGTVGTFVVTE